MIPILAALAYATPQGGWRVGTAEPSMDAAMRMATAFDSDGMHIAQATLRAQAAWKGLALEIQVPGALVWLPHEDWHDAGFGPTRFSLRYHMQSKRAWHSCGLEVALPLSPVNSRVDAWATVARETVPGLELLTSWQTTRGAVRPTTLRVAAGPRLDYAGPWIAPVAELGLVQILPVAKRVDVVLEGELMIDHTPLSLRSLLRWSPTDSTAIDLGVQVPVLDVRTEPSLQPIGQARVEF